MLKEPLDYNTKLHFTSLRSRTRPWVCWCVVPVRPNTGLSATPSPRVSLPCGSVGIHFPYRGSVLRRWFETSFDRVSSWYDCNGASFVRLLYSGQQQHHSSMSGPEPTAPSLVPGTQQYAHALLVQQTRDYLGNQQTNSHMNQQHNPFVVAPPPVLGATRWPDPLPLRPTSTPRT